MSSPSYLIVALLRVRVLVLGLYVTAGEEPVVVIDGLPTYMLYDSSCTRQSSLPATYIPSLSFIEPKETPRELFTIEPSFCTTSLPLK